MPRTLKVTRTLMFAVTAFTGLLIVTLLLVVGVGAESLALAAWLTVPGAVNLWLALRLPRAGIGVRRGIIALEIAFILFALAGLGQGDPRGVTNLIIPITILVLVTRPSATRFFRTAK